MTTLKEIWQAEVARVIVPFKLMMVGVTTLFASMTMMYVMIVLAQVQNSSFRWAAVPLATAISLLAVVGALIVLYGLIVYCFPSVPGRLAAIRRK